MAKQVFLTPREVAEAIQEVADDMRGDYYEHKEKSMSRFEVTIQRIDHLTLAVDASSQEEAYAKVIGAITDGARFADFLFGDWADEENGARAGADSLSIVPPSPHIS